MVWHKGALLMELPEHMSWVLWKVNFRSPLESFKIDLEACLHRSRPMPPLGEPGVMGILVWGGRADLVYSKTHSFEYFVFQSLAGATEFWPVEGVT